MRISPWVGVSRPAIMRRSVVFPEPDGPRKTRNSPSWVTRSTSLTAPSCPCLKTFVTLRVSPTAIVNYLLAGTRRRLPSGKERLRSRRRRPASSVKRSFPAREDPLVLRFGRLGGVLRRLVAARHLGEHGRDDPGAERLVDACRRVARVADVRRPVEHVGEDLVLVLRVGGVVVLDDLLDVGDRRREAREVVPLAGVEPILETGDVVDQELLCAVLVLGEVPDHVAVH